MFLFLLFALTSQQEQVIQEAASSLFYSIDVVNTEIEGIPRTIVIVGEMHRKTDAASQLGKKLISEFPYRGIEMPPGLDIAKGTWVNQALIAWAFMVDRSIGYIGKKLGAKKGYSSVLDALHRGWFVSQDNELIYNGYQLLSFETDGTYYDFARVQKIAPHLEVQDRSQFFTQLQNISQRMHQVRKAIDPSFEASKYKNPFPLRDQPVHKEFYTDLTIGLEYGPLNLFDGSRDLRMSQNLICFLKEFSEVDTMLVIVGKLHMPGIRRHLIKPSPSCSRF